MAGLAPATLRQPAPAQPSMPDPADVVVEIADAGVDVPEIDQDGAILKIEHGDGSVTVSLDGRPIEDAPGRGGRDWFANLADEIDEGELSRIAEDLLRGIDSDIRSREEWLQNRATGLKLLGLTIELPSGQGGGESAPVEGMSRVRHPLLLEAVLRFQANARSELLPTDGPVKIRNDDPNETPDEDDLADDLEIDLNHYLTVDASEYYPDTDRMLLMLGFGGTTFKKVYKCPLRGRPVSETVDAEDLIVNNDATDLRNALRITHRTYLRPSVVKRLQLIGVYRNVDLGTPNPRKSDALQKEKKAQEGIAASVDDPEDRDREIYECYCELDIKGFEHRYKGKVSELEVPYRVTIDVSSKQILSIVRNYSEDDKELPTARMRFVKYTFVPGFGFYDIGLLHISGNTTNALTALWRESIDAGMFANFPGFLIAKQGARQNTNLFRIPPGGGAQVDTGNLPINQVVMPLPYKEPGPAMMQLIEAMEETGQRVAGTAELQVGEGRADVPVGTVIATIEQAMKVESAVHKRLHAAQAEEFQLLKECFRENPESFLRMKGRSGRQWDEQTFLRALENVNLTPQADPNTASHIQRVLKVMAVKQLQAADSSLYDPLKVDTACLKAIGWRDPNQFFSSPKAQASPPPELLQAQAKTQADATKAQASLMTAQANMLKARAEAARGSGQPQVDTPVDRMQAQARLMDAETNRQRLGLDAADRAATDHREAADRQSREKLEVVGLAKDLLIHKDQQLHPAVHQANPVDENA